METSQVNGQHDKTACTQTNTKNSTKHAEQQDIQDIQNKIFFVVLIFSIFINILYSVKDDFSKKC